MKQGPDRRISTLNLFLPHYVLCFSVFSRSIVAAPTAKTAEFQPLTIYWLLIFLFPVFQMLCKGEELKDWPCFCCSTLWPFFPTLMRLDMIWSRACSPQRQSGQGVRLMISVWKLAFQQLAAPSLSARWDGIWHDIWAACGVQGLRLLMSYPLAYPPASAHYRAHGDTHCVFVYRSDEK